MCYMFMIFEHLTLNTKHLTHNIKHITFNT